MKSHYFIQLAYKGTNYHGWQIQPNAISVQEEIQKALHTAFRVPISIVGCGRTDTGVHATDFYAHFDYSEELEKSSFLNRINGILPHDIAIFDLIKVDDKAHTRFNATARTYHYFINKVKSPFYNDSSYFLRKKIDLDKMNEASKLLIRKADFGCFSKSNTQVNTNICDITNAKWSIEPNGQIKFEITANRFLRGMVRAIVGTLIWVGEGKMSLEQLEELIESKDRTKAGFSVPAKGLFLVKIDYPYL